MYFTRSLCGDSSKSVISAVRCWSALKMLDNRVPVSGDWLAYALDNVVASAIHKSHMQGQFSIYIRVDIPECMCVTVSLCKMLVHMHDPLKEGNHERFPSVFRSVRSNCLRHVVGTGSLLWRTKSCTKEDSMKSFPKMNWITTSCTCQDPKQETALLSPLQTQICLKNAALVLIEANHTYANYYIFCPWKKQICILGKLHLNLDTRFQSWFI